MGQGACSVAVRWGSDWRSLTTMSTGECAPSGGRRRSGSLATSVCLGQSPVKVCNVGTGALQCCRPSPTLIIALRWARPSTRSSTGSRVGRVWVREVGAQHPSRRRLVEREGRRCRVGLWGWRGDRSAGNGRPTEAAFQFGFYRGRQPRTGGPTRAAHGRPLLPHSAVRCRWAQIRRSPTYRRHSCVGLIGVGDRRG